MAYLGENIKKLGFGLMRLPQKDESIFVERGAATKPPCCVRLRRQHKGEVWRDDLPTVVKQRRT